MYSFLIDLPSRFRNVDIDAIQQSKGGRDKEQSGSREKRWRGEHIASIGRII